jgi:hypothetical protein
MAKKRKIVHTMIYKALHRKLTNEKRERTPPPPTIGKNMIFWRKIGIFHTKYPKNFRASLRSALFF